MTVRRRLLFVFGTRPEFIKLYPVIVEARSRGHEIGLASTGQHREMLTQLLDYFDVDVDFDLAIMSDSSGLSSILANAVSRLDPVVRQFEPDLVLVHGDTSSTLAGSLVGFYHQLPVAHVEAGLRTHRKYSPYPEEMNRHLTGVIADEHFAPTELSRDNLLAEGVDGDRIHVVGNSAIDMLRYTVRSDYSSELLSAIGNRRIILVTVHRRENLDRLRQVFGALNGVAREFAEDHELVFPVHMNPIVREAARTCFDADNVRLVEPLDTVDFHNIMARSHLVMTDSGGIQEEAPSLGKPVLVLRDTTERPEGVQAGTLRLVGTNPMSIAESARRLLTDEAEYARMATVRNPYGDGTTALRILETIEDPAFWERQAASRRRVEDD